MEFTYMEDVTNAQLKTQLLETQTALDCTVGMFHKLCERQGIPVSDLIEVEEPETDTSIETRKVS